jgi:hypothetical protein
MRAKHCFETHRACFIDNFNQEDKVAGGIVKPVVHGRASGAQFQRDGIVLNSLLIFI